MIETIDEYAAFLATKRKHIAPVGFEPTGTWGEYLFPFQRDIVRFCLTRGRAAAFASTGLGKTRISLCWADHVCCETGMPTLILAPLAVAQQTVNEGASIGVTVTHCREASDVRSGINITNYERFERFDPSMFGAIVLDESSLLKNVSGAMRRALTDSFVDAKYKLCCTATPSPNDVMELCNHAEFLGTGTRSEILATYFTHDGSDTSKWVLKGHGANPFWQFVSEWAMVVRHPRDIGHDEDGYDLPGLEIIEHIVEPQHDHEETGTLFRVEASTLGERRSARKASLNNRVATAVATVEADLDEPWLIWVDYNAEADTIMADLSGHGAIEVRGPDDPEVKEERLLGFAAGKYPILITKPSIAAHGLNLQNCARMIFVGLSDSFEQNFQAIRRCYRFGQSRKVIVHYVLSRAEGAVLANLRRKEKQYAVMGESMVAVIGEAQRERAHTHYDSTKVEIPNWLSTSSPTTSRHGTPTASTFSNPSMKAVLA